MSTRFEATRKKLHLIHKILQRHLNYNEISYFNFFQKPAKNKISINPSKIDVEYANLIFNCVVEILQPTKIIFKSQLAYKNLKNKESYPKDFIKRTVHPNSTWWNRKMKKYNNKSGKELFAE